MADIGVQIALGSQIELNQGFHEQSMPLILTDIGSRWKYLMKLSVGAFALAFAIWGGVGLFLTTWWLIGTGSATGELLMIERIYIGYQVTPVGSLVGLAWGFSCGAICGGIFASLYNFLDGWIGAGAKHLADRPT